MGVVKCSWVKFNEKWSVDKYSEEEWSVDGSSEV